MGPASGPIVRRPIAPYGVVQRFGDHQKVKTRVDRCEENPKLWGRCQIWGFPVLGPYGQPAGKPFEGSATFRIFLKAFGGRDEDSHPRRLGEPRRPRRRRIIKGGDAPRIRCAPVIRKSALAHAPQKLAAWILEGRRSPISITALPPCGRSVLGTSYPQSGFAGHGACLARKKPQTHPRHVSAPRHCPCRHRLSGVAYTSPGNCAGGVGHFRCTHFEPHIGTPGFRSRTHRTRSL